jgi:hypothetical protein
MKYYLILFSTDERSFQCPLCDMTFRTPGQRNMHVSSHKQDSNPSVVNIQPEVHPDVMADVMSNVMTNVMTDVAAPKPNDPKEDQIVRIVHTAPVIQPLLGQQTDGHQSIDVNASLGALGGDQIAFNPDGAVSSDSNGFLALNENNQLVANLQFLLANGLVTIQTEDPALASQLPLTSSSCAQNDFLATSVVQKVQDQANDLQVIFAADMPDAVVPPLTNEDDFQLNDNMVLQLENIDSTVPDKNDENGLKQPKTPR